MLSRTADHVYWLGRYVERAETLARTLDVQYRLSLLPRQAQSKASAGAARSRRWACRRVPRALRRQIRAHRVIDSSPSTARIRRSILSCLRAARENARAVRGAITSEMWETINATWLEARTNAPPVAARNVADSSTG